MLFGPGLDHQTAGPSGRRTIGPPDHRTAGPLAPDRPLPGVCLIGPIALPGRAAGRVHQGAGRVQQGAGRVHQGAGRVHQGAGRVQQGAGTYAPTGNYTWGPLTLKPAPTTACILAGSEAHLCRVRTDVEV